MKTADFHIEDHGTVVLVIPATDAARDWTAENVDAPIVMGGSIPVDHRLAQPLLEGIADGGFSIGD